MSKADLMLQIFVNIKKKANWNTRGQLDSELKSLSDIWKEMQDRHQIILDKATQEDFKLSYFQDEFITKAKATFDDARSKLYDVLHGLSSPVVKVEVKPQGQDTQMLGALKGLTEKITASSSRTQNLDKNITHINRRKLPPIDSNSSH